MAVFAAFLGFGAIGFTPVFKLNVVEMANAPARGIPSTVSGFESLTVAGYLERWLAHAHTRVRASTYDGYHDLLHCHALPALGQLPLTELHPLHLQDLYTRLLTPAPGRRTLSAGTVRNLHLVLSHALRQAVRWQLLDTNPAAGAQPPRPRRPQPTIADAAMLHTLLRLLQHHPLEVPATIALTTGMRRGEILALRWSDLSSDYTSAHIQQTLQPTSSGLRYQQPKTHRSRRAVALPNTLATLLARHREDQTARRTQHGDRWHDANLIIDRGDGDPLHPDSLSSAWRRFIKQNELPRLRFHDLRHSHATLMLLEGIHPKIVSERLGHATIAITLDVYSHILPSMQTEAAEAIDRLINTEHAA